jgi:catechol 2,3-dioxygenase-like lactoylglutathione lyase family enzyme
LAGFDISRRENMIRQLAHACFYTGDIGAMVDFYSAKLKLPIQFTLENRAGAIFGYYFACGNSTFIEVFDRELAVKEWGGDVEAPPGAARYRHLCLEVTGLKETCEELQERGVKVSEEIHEGLDHSLQAWIKDPDGNDIELMEYTHRSLQLASGGKSNP